MRVAYVLPSIGQPGGWQSHAKGFLGSISRHVSPTLFVSEADRPYVEQTFPDYERVPLPTTQLATTDRAGIRSLYSSYVATIVGRCPQVDLVHSLEAYPTGLVGHWLANRLLRPHVITIHGTYGLAAGRRAVDRLLYSRVLRNARVLCPVSHGTGRLVTGHFPDATKDVWVQPILNGNDYYLKASRTLAEERTPPARPRVLSVGAVKRRKGYHTALSAFAEVQRVLPDASYHIVGRIDSNEYRAELRNLIEREGIRNVRFLSQISSEDLRREYESASLFLLAPEKTKWRFEGFGLVYIEAGAFGLPVVGTRSGGVEDAVRDQQTGLLAASGDAHGLATAMLQILSDDRLAKRLGLAGRVWSETLTWRRNAEQQVSVYNRILAGSSATNGLSSSRNV